MFDRPFKPLLTRAISASSAVASTSWGLTADEQRMSPQAAIYNPDATHSLYCMFGSSTSVASVPAAGSAVTGLIHVPPASQILVSVPENFTYSSVILEAGGTGTVQVMLGRVQS